MGGFAKRIVMSFFPATLLAAGLLTATHAIADERFSTAGRSDLIVIRVDVSEQRMVVMRGGRRMHDWPVSTARAGKITPRGTYQPQWFSRDHKSSLYDGAPMPFSIFYSGNYAIHGTYATGALGRPASAGCVRLSPENARVLYEMVYATDKADTYIVVQD